MAVRKDLPSMNTRCDTVMLDHFKPLISAHLTLIPQAEARIFLPLLMSVQLARISGSIFPQLNQIRRQKPWTIDTETANR